MPKGVYPRKSLEEIFWEGIKKSRGCWKWTKDTRGGYGVIWLSCIQLSNNARGCWQKRDSGIW